MNADGKIYIIVTDKMPNGQTPTPEGADTQQSNGEKDGLFGHWAKNRLLGLVKQTATQSVMYTLNNIGNFTGDYMTQQHVNDSLHTLNSLMGIGTAAIAGAKYGGPWGALIGATLAVVQQGVSSGFQIWSNMVQNRKTNYEIAQLRSRAGLDASLDGSRGTEN